MAEQRAVQRQGFARPTNANRGKRKPFGNMFDIVSVEELALNIRDNMKAGGSSSLKIPCSMHECLTCPCGLSTVIVCKVHELVTDAEILWILKVVTSHPN